MSSEAMQAKKPGLAELRSLLSERLTKPRKEMIRFSGLPAGCPGIPRSALTEISGRAGTGRSAWVLKALAENPMLRVAWIERELSVYPAAFPQAGVALERALFVEAGTKLVWSALQVLRSGIFEVVVLADDGPRTEIELRRLQLAAEKAGASVFLLNESPTPSELAWPFALRLQVEKVTRRVT